MWYDSDRYPLEQFAAKTLDTAKMESPEAVMMVLAARITIHLGSIAETLDNGRSDLTSISTAIINKVVSPSGTYVPPAFDAADIQNLTRAITSLQETILEMSPEKRGLVYQADKPLEVPD